MRAAAARTPREGLPALRSIGFGRVAASPCQILLTPHPSGSNMRDRLVGTAPLFDENACKAYAAKQSASFDARLAKETTP